MFEAIILIIPILVQNKRPYKCTSVCVCVWPLGPHAQRTVPAAGGQRGAIGRDARAADLVLVAVQQTDALLLERVPDVHRVVVVAGEQQPPANREVHRVDAKNDAVLGVDGHLFVGAYVEQAALGTQNTTRTR